MNIHNRFEVPLPPDQAWAVLLDIPRIAPCMPGARLISVDGDDAYTGEVQVRLGPVVMSFRGQARITSKDEANRSATVRAEGRDQKGRGGATADVTFRMVPAGAGTAVEIDTALTLSGSVAQYGRGAGMINDLANHLIGQFAGNLRKELDAARPAPVETPAVVAEPVTGETAQVAAAAPAVAPAQAQPEASPISGFRLGLWLAWRQFLRLIGRNPA
ncbi:SRPBCC family protein [Azospirillum sp. RWY-5-1]|uniref:SRPBCC family protein n=1 Tax=Azospirillum oleiclasticum TaxID=2735135 RepID=A0ABX2T9P8_9PROT|nr:SRPBCC family protein [Azospirillum oleiclasticum]NYZ13696.1 SRPBCC family protein [Azospirillum oleiclasticum]NYZ20968.1 SRPBCC family protein [Azospirillum oleiclasticum]